MPGPGGGGHSGGFGGGSHGGGFGGGGRGFGGGSRGPRGPRGPYYRPYRRRYFFGFPFGYYGGYYGGGLLGGFVAALILPIVLLAFMMPLFVWMIVDTASVATQGGVVVYDEQKFQQYADEQYAQVFHPSSDYENNLLIVFASDESRDGYYCIAWTGNHIVTEINEMFGDEYTTFGRTVNSTVSQTYHEYSFSRDLAGVADKMGDAVAGKMQSAGLTSPFRKNEESPRGVPSHVIDYAGLVKDHETVDDALEDFTEQTGIPIVMVVENSEIVFGKSLPAGSIFILFILAVFIILAVVLIVKALRTRSKQKKAGANAGTQNDRRDTFTEGSDNRRW